MFCDGCLHHIPQVWLKVDCSRETETGRGRQSCRNALAQMDVTRRMFRAKLWKPWPQENSQMENGTMFPCPTTRISVTCCWQHPGLKVRWTWPSLWWDLLKNLTLMFVFEHLLLLTAASSLPLSWSLPVGTDCLWASVNGRVQEKMGVSICPAPVYQQVTLLPYRMRLPASSLPGLFLTLLFIPH